MCEPKYLHGWDCDNNVHKGLELIFRKDNAWMFEAW
jgi:hypothetical protein